MTDTAPTNKLKTYEVWIAKLLAAALTGAYLTGLIPTSGTAAEIAGVAATMLGYLGFAVVRSMGAPLAVHVLDTPAPPNKQSGRISMTLVALLAFLAVAACSLSMSCTAAQKKAVSDFGHCEETAAVKDLEGPIKSIGDQFIAGKLTKDSAMALLDSFAASYGLDTVGCAVTLVGQLFSSKVSGSADTGAATNLYNEWLAKHRQASAAPKYREVAIGDGSAMPDDVFLKAEQGINRATAQVAQMRAELAAAPPCGGSVLSIGVDGNLTCTNGLTDVMPGSYVPAVVACPVDNMPGSVSSDIPCNATVTLAAPTGKP